MMQLEGAPSAKAAIVRRLAPSHAAVGRFGLILVMVLMMAILTILQPAYFLTRENLTNIARQISSNAILALGEFAVIVTAGIDLSVGSVMGLSMIVLALAVHADWAAGLAALAALCAGLGVGLINGLALTRLHLPHPFIATLATLNIARVGTYALSGALAGVAGVLLAGRVNSGYPTAGTGAELDAIAAVIIGGASFFGGRGTAGGVFIGAVIMGLLRNGLNLMNVSVFWQQVLLGFIILLAVYLDVLRRRAMRLEG